MKTKLHLTTMMFLLMALAMSAQPLSVTTKAQPKIHVCNETKIEFKKGKMVSQPIKKVNKDASENKQYCFSYYNPQQSLRLNEDESTNSATVTFIYNLQEQELGTYYVASVMVYNPDWSESWDPDFYDPEDGSPVTGIIVNVPYGTYDIITDTYEQIDPYSNYKHIDELVTIDKDTTIYLNVLNAENKVSWNIYNNNNELFVPKTIRLIDQEPWYEVIDEGNLFNARGLAFLRLDGYGDVHTLNFGYDATPEGSTNPIYYYINELSDRYNFVIMEEEAGNDGMLYVNKLTSNGPNPFPLNNDASAYIAYEEQIQRTPKGINTVQTPLTQLSTYTYLDNSWEWSDDLLSNKAIGEDCIARVMINTTKNNGENLQGVNVGIAVGVIDYESWDVEEYEYEDENGNIVTQVDSTLNAEYIVGPKLMVNDDKSIEFLVHFDVTKSPEIGIWLDDYPAHPKFSYTSEQKKGIVGNSCPLNAIDAQNGWNQWYNANMINLLRLTQHRGRNGEYISSGNVYSTMTAKYNGEEIYNGKFALDSLSWAWCGTQPNGAYELKFTNANVLVDDIYGKNVTTVYFDQTKEDQNPPVLTMLQFRDADNNVTDRFINPNEGTIMYSGGDFEPNSVSFVDAYGYENTWNYEECQPMTVEVSYAPYGSKEWQSLEGIEHESEFDDIPGMGFFYSGSLASVSVPSENKWYDLKFRLEDESGNWQEQVVSPAFKIESLTPDAITEVINGDATEVARYSVDGRHITSPEQGINIVVMSDGTTRKVLVK